MKFRALVLELHLPQNFCHRHTDTQSFSRNSQIVFRTSQNVNPSKTGNRKSKTILSSIYIEESKNERILHLNFCCVPVNSVCNMMAIFSSKNNPSRLNKYSNFVSVRRIFKEASIHKPFKIFDITL